MDQKNNILKFKQMGFSLISNIKDGIVLKSDKGLIISYTDGNYEGFVKKSIEESNLNEIKLSEAIGILSLIGMSITYFTTDITIVDGISMNPTYTNYQIIIKSRSIKDINKLLVSKNTIVKFKSPDEDVCIKRIVGLPGDNIEFWSSMVKINGEVVDALNSNNIKPSQTGLADLVKNQKKIKYQLKSNQYFVMGDNRMNSVDSREYGPIEGNNIISILEK